MMPVVRISDDVFQRLQRHANPLVDSVSDVLTRVLDGYEQHQESNGATPLVSKTATPGTRSRVDVASYDELWAAVARAFNVLDSDHHVPETASAAYFKQVRVGVRDIHYEWALRKRDHRLDVCLHFESNDQAINLSNLEVVMKHEKE